MQSIYIIKILIKVIFIIVPLIIILTSFVSFGKSLLDSDDKKIKDNVVLLGVKILVGSIVFCIPLIFNTVFAMISNNYNQTYWDCYKNASKEKIEYYKLLQKKETEEKLDEKNEANKDGENKNNNSSDLQKPSGNNSPSHGSSDNEDSENSNAEKVPIEQVIYVGDSRTVGMYYSLYNESYQNSVYKYINNEYWYASVGKGYNWFNNTALPEIKNKVSKNNYHVIILMGANDLYNVDLASKYIETIKELSKIYSNSNYVIVSVNPIDDNKSIASGYTVKNSQVLTFNSYLKKSITSVGGNVSYCNTYSYIVNDFSTTDGLHYNNITYKKIYELIKSCI